MGEVEQNRSTQLPVQKHYSRAELAQVIVNEMYQLVGILDKNGINLESNQTSLDAAGIERKEVIGKYFWATPWWPEELRGKLKDAVERAGKGEFVRFEIENKVKEGTIFVDFSLKPVFDDNGKVQFIIPEGRDITLRKKAEDDLAKAYSLLQKQEHELRIAHAKAKQELIVSEDSFRQLAESMPQIVFVAAGDDSTLYFNQQWFTFTDQAPPRDSKDWRRVIHPEDYATFEAKTELAIKNKRETWEVEFRLKRADGAYRWHLGRAVPVLNKSDEVERWFGTLTDIDDQKKYQMDLSKAIRIRDEFLSIASHELKTPLTSLKLQLQMEQRRLNKAHSPENEKAFRSASRQVERLSRLIDDMLDVSRISSGKLTIYHEEFNLSEMVHEAYLGFVDQFEASGCKVEIQCDEEVWGRWDMIRLEQVVINLFTNAIKYGPGRPISIRVFRDKKEACIIVKDSGIGIAPENQSRIFDQFERAVENTEVSGLGLGLYIGRQIVALHSGSIHVESELGKGATFIVRLPC